MSSRSDTIIGRAFRATIAEPWDFSSDAGENILEGQIIDLSSDADAHEWIKCRIKPFRSGKTSIYEAAIVRRYESKASIASQLAKGADVGANILYDPLHGVLSIEKLHEALQKKTGLSFLAGSVRLS